MSPDEFKAWRKAMGQTQLTAAEILGVSRGTIDLYERGARREDGRAVEIPLSIAIACFAWQNWINELSDLASMPHDGAQATDTWEHTVNLIKVKSGIAPNHLASVLQSVAPAAPYTERIREILYLGLPAR